MYVKTHFQSGFFILTISSTSSKGAMSAFFLLPNKTNNWYSQVYEPSNVTHLYSLLYNMKMYLGAKIIIAANINRDTITLLKQTGNSFRTEYFYEIWRLNVLVSMYSEFLYKIFWQKVYNNIQTFFLKAQTKFIEYCNCMNAVCICISVYTNYKMSFCPHYITYKRTTNRLLIPRAVY